MNKNSKIFEMPKYFLIYLLPLILYASFIIYLSSISNIPTIRGLITQEPVPKGSWTGDEITHIIEYSILSLLFYRAIKPTQYQHQAFIITIIFSLIFGLFDEIHQHFVPLRTFSTLDLIWDFLGGLTTRITAKMLL